MSAERRRARRPWLIGTALCGVLAAGAVSPAWADEGADAGAGAPVLGGFALGDAIEGLIDERDGALTVSVPAGGVVLSWDSRGAGSAGASGLPAGWGFGLARVLTEGGVRVSPASGGLYELDASQPSGLAGYGLSDLRFEDLSGGDAAGVVLAARADGAVGERAVRFRLAELGGTVTSFDEAGRPLARVGATGERVDWVHDDSGRLVRVVDADGVVTELGWDTEPGVLLVRPAANLPSSSSDGVERVWRVELDDERVAAVEDPLGGRVEIGLRDGLVDRLSGVSGAVTEVEWQRFDDGVPRVETLQVTDASGTVLSSRTWSRVGSSSSSGWPASGLVGSGPFGVQDPTLSYETELADGATKIRSTYSGLHLLRTREVVATTAAGESTVQEQSFAYPEISGGAFDPSELPRAWSRPSEVDLTSYSRNGASRSMATTYEFDEFGRPIEEVAPDGTVTRTKYDQIVPDAGEPGDGAERAGVPIGLPVEQTVTGPDGATVQTEHKLNDARTAVIETETRTQAPGHELTTTGLTQFDIEADGFVAEQRDYPGGDRAGQPVVTRRDQVTDLAAGTVTVSETVGVGTAAEATGAQTTSLAHGGVIEQTDLVGNAMTASYDALGRPVEQTDASGLITRTTYETAREHGRNATVVTAPGGVATTDVRDALGRSTETLDNIDHGVAVEGHERIAEQRHYPVDRPGTIEVTDAWGATTIVRQDLFGREIQATSATGLTKLSVYDDVANTVTTALTPTGAIEDAALVSTTQSDDAGHPVGTSGARADGVPVPESATTFDGLGRELTATDGSLRSSIAFDARGRPAQRTLTPEHSTAPILTADRRFDVAGNSVEKTLRDDRHARSGGTLAIDGLGRTTATTDQAGRIGTIDYAPDGLPIREITSSGRTIETAYDQHTRAPISTTTTSPAGATVTTATVYDPVTGRATAVYDPADREGTEITYAHDAFGNVTAQRYPEGTEISHEFDAHGRKRSTTDAAGAVTRYDYDDSGLLTAATQYEDATDAADVLASVSYAYDAFARVSRLDRDTGVSTTFSYTSAGEIAEENTARADGATLSKREYSYDRDGSLTQRTDRVLDEATGTLEASTTAYRYDAMRQLTASTVHDGDSTEAPVSRTTGYALMVTGDIETETVVVSPGTPDETRTERAFEYSPRGELVAIPANGERNTQEYDATGNLVRGADGATYSYDAANRPVTTTTPEGATTTFEYWADGTRRTIEHANPASGARSTIELYWDGTTLVNERHSGGTTTATARGDVSYLLGATRHARTTRAADQPGERATSHFTSDRHGNVTELTDDAGAITERYGYTDYGNALESATAATDAPGLERNPYRYAGEFTDLDGSQFLTERLYLPHLLRFASDDRAPEHNDYAFGHLNPIMMVDPSGRTPSADTIAGWVLTGLGALASVASIAGAVLTGGGSMSLLGIAGWMAEGGALAASAMTVADQFTPFLSDEQRLGLNVTEIVLGAASATVSRFGIAEYGQAEGATRRASDEFFQVLSQRRVVWVPHINATPFTHGTNLLLAERAVLADDLVRFGVRNSDQLPAPIATNLSAARHSLHAAFTNVGGGGVSWVAESLAKFRRIAADKRDALTSGWLTRSLSWQDEVAGVDRAVGDHAVAYAALKKMRPEEFAFIDDLQSMKLLITDLTPTSKTTNADLLQMIDSHLVPKYAPEPQRLVLLERGKN